MLEPNLYYEYLVEYHDQNDSSIISQRSNVVNIFSHAPGEVKDIIVNNNKQIEIIFTQPVEKNKLRISNFLIDNNSPSSVSVASDNSYLITFTEKLSVGNHQLSINNLRDFYNSPMNDTIITFDVLDIIEDEDRLFITNYEILDNYNLVINFNFNLDTLTSLNKIIII